MFRHPQFSFWIPIALAKICFSLIVINCAKILCIRRHLPLPFHSQDLRANSPNQWSYKALLAFPEYLVLYQDYPLIDDFRNSHHLTASHHMKIVRRIYLFGTSGSERVKDTVHLFVAGL